MLSLENSSLATRHHLLIAWLVAKYLLLFSILPFSPFIMPFNEGVLDVRISKLEAVWTNVVMSENSRMDPETCRLIHDASRKAQTTDCQLFHDW